MKLPRYLDRGLQQENERNVRHNPTIGSSFFPYRRLPGYNTWNP